MGTLFLKLHYFGKGIGCIHRDTCKFYPFCAMHEMGKIHVTTGKEFS